MINFSEVNPISPKTNLKINRAIYKIIKKKNFILGDEVKKFEKKFSVYTKVKHSIGCGNGTDALILSLMSLNLKKKDEVIVPGLSYVSTALAVVLNRSNLIFADIDEETGLVCIDQIKNKISKNTKAIIPVNLYGQKVDLKKLRKIIGRKIFIIEDSAQSHLAYSCLCAKPHNNCCDNNRNEKYADISCYSFYPAKNLGAYGDGGLITTNNKKIYDKILALRNLGSIKKHEHNLIGLNSRLDTINAAVLSEKINYLNKFNNIRRKISNFYDRNLKKIKDIKITKTNPGSSRHLYVIRCSKRNLLLKYMLKNKILCQIHYPYSLNKLKGFKNLIKNQTLKNSENWANECLSLPLHPKLTMKNAGEVVRILNKFFKKK